MSITKTSLALALALAAVPSANATGKSGDLNWSYTHDVYCGVTTADAVAELEVNRNAAPSKAKALLFTVENNTKEKSDTTAVNFKIQTTNKPANAADPKYDIFIAPNGADFANSPVLVSAVDASDTLTQLPNPLNWNTAHHAQIRVSNWIANDDFKGNETASATLTLNVDCN